MRAYDFDDTVGLDGPDAFAASRAAFEALTVTLGGAKADGWTCDQLDGDGCAGLGFILVKATGTGACEVLSFPTGDGHRVSGNVRRQLLRRWPL